MPLKKGSLIQTRKTRPRSGAVAFILSLVCTGLGQMYNGDLLKGTAFFILRTMPMLLGPVALLKWNPVTSITLLFECVIAGSVIALFAALESMLVARRSDGTPVRIYNRTRYYIAYGAACVILSTLCTLPAAFFFRIAPVESDGTGPLLAEGDWIVVRNYNRQGYGRGDLVVLNNGYTGRIIALAGDAARYADNIFFVNGSPLPLGYLPDGVIRKFSRDTYDIVSESNAERKYPVRFKAARRMTLAGLKTPVPPGHVLLAADTRLKEGFAAIVPLDSISGRVEGIIFSQDAWKIGMDSCADLK